MIQILNTRQQHNIFKHKVLAILLHFSHPNHRRRNHNRNILILRSKRR